MNVRRVGCTLGRVAAERVDRSKLVFELRSNVQRPKVSSREEMPVLLYRKLSENNDMLFFYFRRIAYFFVIIILKIKRKGRDAI